LHDLLRNFGWEVQRTRTLERSIRDAYLNQELDKWEFCRRYNANTVLDIGANSGQFAELIRRVLPECRIVSFEPLQQCYKQLKDNKNIGQPFTALQMALGNESGTVSINRNDFSPSSSILPMNQLHVSELPQTAKTTSEEIRVEKLDEISASINIRKPYFVKIDVQGFEGQVIQGGRQTLVEAEAVIVEISCLPLYEGAPSFDQIYQMMKGIGFEYRGNVDQWKSSKDDRILQIDALFEPAGTGIT
jgi:FkbM family methyltransferase